ncbi:MAG TPA: hypothetical protein VK021_01540 [Flavobacteriaceae bacterium]|nr:hypothetical protein [Flavobacteriaceae bacterium]
MVLKTLHIYVGISLVLFLTVEGMRFFSIAAPNWMFHYLNDFLVIPIVGLICLYVVWWLKKDRTIRLDIFSIATLVVIYSLYFEVYLPKYSERYTADILDVVCYASGGVVFYFLQKMR